MLVFNIATSPAYAQSWNLQRSGSNLNFYFSGAGANALQLTSSGNGTFTGNITGTNITLTPSNPNITSGGSYVTIPNGLYISGGTFYAQNQLQARGGVNNDSGTPLVLSSSNGSNVVQTFGVLKLGNLSLYREAGDRYVQQYSSTNDGTGTRYYLNNGTPLGYVYGDPSGFGFYRSGGSAWAIRTDLNSGNTQIYGNLSADQLNSTGQVQTNEWFRINGPQGIYWNSYGGGWYMSDSTYLRSYGTKPVLAPYYADQDSPGYFMDPASTSRLGPITQAYGSYIFPGDVSGGLGSFQASYYLASSSYWGLYTNTGFSANDLYSRVDTYARYGGGGYQTKIGYIAQTGQGGIETGGHLTLHTTGGGSIYYFTDSSQSNIFGSNGNIWMAWCGCWISNWLNQSVTVNSNPDFGNISINNAWFEPWSNWISAFLNAPSDRRLKKNIQPLEEDAVKNLDKLNPVSFEWRETASDSGFPNEKGTKYGFIAQDVEQIFPDMIMTAGNGYKSIHYEQITALLVANTKELKRENHELSDQLLQLKQDNEERSGQKDTEIKSLQEKIMRLEQSLDDLKKQINSGKETN